MSVPLHRRPPEWFRSVGSYAAESVFGGSDSADMGMVQR
jgi:hypothetical protein